METFRKTVAAYGPTMLAEALRPAIDAGQIQPTGPIALAHLILASMHEASGLILSAPDP